MRVRLLLRYVLIIAIILFVVLSRNHVFGRQDNAQILLIGNSFTFSNEGIDKQLLGLAPASQISRVATGGYTLEAHWNDQNTRQIMRDSNWTHIVLQEQSQRPVFEPDQFRKFAEELDREIRRLNAQTVLLMTWERPDSVDAGITTANLAAAYNALGNDLNAKVAPAGLAFARSLAERPDLVLYSPDGHPTLYGTYLAACVLYGTIFERSPVGNPYSASEFPSEVGEYFQRIAAETLGY